MNAVGQGGDLSDHVHPVAVLVLVANLDDLARCIPVHPFAGNAQATQVEIFQYLGDFAGRRAFGDQAAAGVKEFAGEGRVRAAAGVTWAGREADGAPTGDSLGLEARDNGTGVDDVLREQIGRAHQNAHLHTALHQWCGHRCDHGTGLRVVNATGKQHMHVGGIGRLHLGEQDVNHLLPQREAGDRADMAAAFPPFEDKAAGALFEIHLEQRRCRCMDVSGNAFGFEMGGLVRPATGDECIAGLAGEDGLDLFFAQLLRDESEQTNAPRGVANTRARLFQQAADLLSTHQGQRQHRQPATLGNTAGKCCRIRDSGHGALDDRVPRAVRLRQWRVGRQRSLGGGLLDMGL